MTLQEEFLAWKPGKICTPYNVVFEVFFLKCNDQIVKRLLVTNINNHFEGDLHGQQVENTLFQSMKKGRLGPHLVNSYSKTQQMSSLNYCLQN
jgi:hypothetical protein